MQEDCTNYPEIPENKKKEMSELITEHNSLKRKIEAEVEPGNDIFGRLDDLYCYIERHKIGENIPMIEEENEVSKCLMYIWTALQEYSKIENPSLNDALETFKKLIIYSGNIEVFIELADLNELAEKSRKEHLKKCSPAEKMMLEMYSKYMEWKAVNKLLDNFEFNILTTKWCKFQDDLVSINNSDLYLKINDFYDGLSNILTNVEVAKSIVSEATELLKSLEKIETKLKRKAEFL